MPFVAAIEPAVAAALDATGFASVRGLRMQLLAAAEWAERIGELECATHERHGQAADIRRTATKRRLRAELFGVVSVQGVPADPFPG